MAKPRIARAPKSRMGNSTWKEKRIERAARKAEIKRYKAETKALNRQSKAQYKQQVARAKALQPIELGKQKTSIAKHATWATAAQNIFGKGASVGKDIAVSQSAAGQNQNVNGGLGGTSNGRDDDEEKDTVDGGGVVY